MHCRKAGVDNLSVEMHPHSLLTPPSTKAVNRRTSPATTPKTTSSFVRRRRRPPPLRQVRSTAAHRRSSFVGTSHRTNGATATQHPPHQRHATPRQSASSQALTGDPSWRTTNGNGHRTKGGGRSRRGRRQDGSSQRGTSIFRPGSRFLPQGLTPTARAQPAT